MHPDVFKIKTGADLEVDVGPYGVFELSGCWLEHVRACTWRDHNTDLHVGASDFFDEIGYRQDGCGGFNGRRYDARMKAGREKHQDESQ